MPPEERERRSVDFDEGFSEGCGRIMLGLRAFLERFVSLPAPSFWRVVLSSVDDDDPRLSRLYWTGREWGGGNLARKIATRFSTKAEAIAAARRLHADLMNPHCSRIIVVAVRKAPKKK